jgi:predicted nucleic acid-binding protein
MNVVDSSGWLEYFAEGPNAEFFSMPIEAIGELIVPIISIYEVFKRVLQQRDETAALEAIAFMQSGDLVDLTRDTALHAARLSIDLQLPMADSIILATAREWDAVLWTQDADFEGIEGVQYHPKI